MGNDNMATVEEMQAALDRMKAKTKQKSNSRCEDDSTIKSPQRRRSYAVEEARIRVSERKRSSDGTLNGQDAKRRKTYPVLSNRASLSRSKPWGYDISKSQTAQRRQSSLVRYHETVGGYGSLYRCRRCTMTFKELGLLEAHVAHAHTEVSDRAAPRRSPSVIVIEDNSPSPKPGVKRKISIIVLEDDDNDSGQDKVRTHKEHAFLEDMPKPPPRKRRRTGKKSRAEAPAPPKTPKSPRTPKIQDPKKGAVDGEIELACAYCPNRFFSMAEKQSHLQSEHPDRFDRLKAHCWACPFRFRSIADLTAHIEAAHTEKTDKQDTAKKKLTCWVCYVKIPKIAMRHHVRNKHHTAYNDDLTLTQMENKYCVKCKALIDVRKFKSLKGHILKVHKELYKRALSASTMLAPFLPAEAKGGDVDIPRTEFVKCPVCEKRYVAARLERHMGLKHSDQVQEDDAQEEDQATEEVEG